AAKKTRLSRIDRHSPCSLMVPTPCRSSQARPQIHSHLRRAKATPAKDTRMNRRHLQAVPSAGKLWGRASSTAFASHLDELRACRHLLHIRRECMRPPCRRTLCPGPPSRRPSTIRSSVTECLKHQT
ncbi:hypothetical protein EJB05_08362, partial [Eragrostis curvula]